MKRWILACAVLLGACSGGDSTGPSGGGGNTNANVAGTWTYNATNLSGGGASCDYTGAVLQLNQTGTTFTGTYSGRRTVLPRRWPERVNLGAAQGSSGQRGRRAAPASASTSTRRTTTTPER